MSEAKLAFLAALVIGGSAVSWTAAMLLEYWIPSWRRERLNRSRSLRFQFGTPPESPEADKGPPGHA